jgi:hypothetical protein
VPTSNHTPHRRAANSVDRDLVFGLQKHRVKLISTLVVLTLAVAAAQANVVIFMGDTTDALTWNRPVANGDLPPTGLSTIGTAVPYEVAAFTVSVDGNYDFLFVATLPANWDNYSFLYQDTFDATQPLDNVVIGNDDFPGSGSSGFNGVSLTAETQYYFVETGFANLDRGVYDLTISGPGNVQVVVIPEPRQLFALTLVGIGGFLLRQRRQAAK